jgi:hypothetical protein
MDPAFLQKLQSMFRDNPQLSLTSGFRTRAEQIDLYARKPGLAARPGTSKHERGLAADIGPESQYGWLAANAGKYGLEKTVSYEPWHFEPNGSRSGSETAQLEQDAAPASAGGGENAVPVSFTFYGNKYGSISESELAKGLFGSTPGTPEVPMGGGTNQPQSQAASAGAGAPQPGSGGGALSVNQAAQYARAAGFNGGSLSTALAVAIAESGLRPDAKGDVSLQNGTWGPSVGLMQIRSINAQKGTGGQRDENTNTNPGTNMRNAFAISSGGSNWQPWSTYKSGGYRQHLGRVNAALSSGVGDPEGPAAAGGRRGPVPAMVGRPMGGSGGNQIILQMIGFSEAEVTRTAYRVKEILDEDSQMMVLGSA